MGCCGSSGGAAPAKAKVVVPVASSASTSPPEHTQKEPSDNGKNSRVSVPKFCMSCGGSLVFGRAAKFCPHCGFSLPTLADGDGFDPTAFSTGGGRRRKNGRFQIQRSQSANDKLRNSQRHSESPRPTRRISSSSGRFKLAPLSEVAKTKVKAVGHISNGLDRKRSRTSPMGQPPGELSRTVAGTKKSVASRRPSNILENSSVQHLTHLSNFELDAIWKDFDSDGNGKLDKVRERERERHIYKHICMPVYIYTYMYACIYICVYIFCIPYAHTYDGSVRSRTWPLH
jgi:hypothetical protein